MSLFPSIIINIIKRTRYMVLPWTRSFTFFNVPSFFSTNTIFRSTSSSFIIKFIISRPRISFPFNSFKFIISLTSTNFPWRIFSKNSITIIILPGTRIFIINSTWISFSNNRIFWPSSYTFRYIIISYSRSCFITRI